ncbi:MAG TPA: DUF4331 family protein, partial [Chitinophagaceae bacterium]|nr:DUF4331 family protein [Chitinophagaceae bacterium]
QNGRPQDGLACLNVNTIVLDVPIKTLQKDGKDYLQAKNILDPEFVIGVWASASRQSMRVLNTDGTRTHSGNWVQVSRLGMPLTNEAIIPFGQKDLWNSLTPYEDLANLDKFGEYFYNPELALYMDEAQLAKAVPAFKQLRIQKKSLGAFGFGNYQDGLFPLKGNAALNGTALGAFPDLLLPGPGKPRSVDIWPIFHTGVPNLRPYQLAVQKGGNPLAAGKPFISNFLPNGGDMLRLNMAVPVTKRDDPEFSSLGLVQAAVLGLTDPRFNKTKDLQYIPNMDGFPNGRRLEDDITRIELQAVSGVVLAAIGLWYDDYIPGSSPSPVTQDLVDVLSYTTGVEKNDTAFRPRFPFIQGPWSAKHNCYCSDDDMEQTATKIGSISEAPKPLGLSAPELILSAAPNPVADNNTVRYRVSEASHVRISVFDAAGQPVKVLVNRQHEPGTYSVQWNTKGMAQGVYFVAAHKNGVAAQNVRIVKE